MEELTRKQIAKELIERNNGSMLVVRILTCIMLGLGIWLAFMIKTLNAIPLTFILFGVLLIALDIRACKARSKTFKLIEEDKFTVKSVKVLRKSIITDNDGEGEYDTYILDFGEPHGEIDVCDTEYEDTNVGDMFYIVYYEDETDIILMYNQNKYKYYE